MPPLLALDDLVRWQLQPRRAYVAGESPIEEMDLDETEGERHRFDQDALADAAKVFATVELPLRLSELLSGLAADGCPATVQDAVTLEVLETFDPEDEADLPPFLIRIAARGGLTAPRCQGDDLWIEPGDIET